MAEDLQRILDQLSSAQASGDHHEAVQLCRQALPLTSREEDPQLWSALQFTLAGALTQDPAGEQADNLEKSIIHFRRALEVRNREQFPEDWAAIQNDLGIAYWDRVHGERAENLERAIRHYRLALEVRSRKGSPQHWAATHNNLASAYRNRIRAVRAENLEQAIGHYRQALQVFTRKAFPPQWASIQNSLALVYADRIRGLKAENMERAVGHFKRALKVYTQEAFPQNWALAQNNLGGAYAARIKGVRADNLERAIAHCRRALEVHARETSPKAWAKAQSRIGIAYLNRIRGERAQNLERAIAHFKQALQVYGREAFPEDWAMIQNNLANACWNRIRGERAENMEQSILHYQQVLEVHTQESSPENWALAQNNLAIAYIDRMRGASAENLEQAIAHLSRALEVWNRDAFPQDWAMAQSNLAIAFWNRIRGERADNLERAIAHCRRALEVHSRQAFPEDWAKAQNNLANIYSERLRGERAENIEQAIFHYREALEVFTQDAFPTDWAKAQNNLGNVYRERIQGKPGENMEMALRHYRRALKVRSLQASPYEHWQTQQNLGAMCFAQELWDEAIDAYCSALAANDALYLATATPEARQSELVKLENVPARLAYALVRRRNQDRRPLEEALLVIEHNRARWLQEALGLRAAGSERVSSELLGEFEDGAQRVRELQAESRLPEDTPAKRDYLTITKLLREAYAKLEAVAEKIRAIDPDFMPAPSLNDIQKAAQSAPLVYLLITPAGGLALIAQCAAVTPVLLNATEEEFVGWLTGTVEDSAQGGWLGCYQRRNDSENAHREWLKTLDATTSSLWNRVMGPVAECLHGLGEEQGDAPRPVVLVPTGLLSLLPLHAAWTEDQAAPCGRRYFLDEFRVSYSPSALALSRGRATAPSAPNASFLAAAEPRPVSAGGLQNAQREVESIASLFPQSKILSREDATREALLDGLPAAQVAHFCCHATNDWSDPLKSGLLMAHDQMLTMRDMLALWGAGGRLATLSACETGIVGTTLPDEAVALPGALVQAGFAAVVASLWAVDDISTAMLMERFYRLWRKEGLEPVDALRRAQRWLRDTTNGQKADYYRAFIPDLGGTKTGMAESVAIDSYNAMMSHPSGQQARAFEHPYFWAAFYLTGV